MKHKGYLVERYYKYKDDWYWGKHKFTDSMGSAKASITQARKRHYKDDVFRIIELVSNEEEIKT